MARRQYYERVNALIDQYTWADSLLNSTLVPRLLNSYDSDHQVTPIAERPMFESTSSSASEAGEDEQDGAAGQPTRTRRTPLKRTPSYVRRMVDEETPLLEGLNWGGEDHSRIV